MKLISNATLWKVKDLCLAHGVIVPAEGESSHSRLTCYNYGIPGALFKRNLIMEWSKAISSGNNIHVLKKIESNIRSDIFEITGDGKQFKSLLYPGMLKHYLPVLKSLDQRLPFGLLGQKNSGQDFELDEEKFIYGSTEQTELCMQYFSDPKQALHTFDFWQTNRLQWWKHFSGTPSNFMISGPTGTSVNGQAEELHIKYAFPWGLDTVEVIRNRRNTDLLQIQTDSGTSHEAVCGSKLVIPHMIECITRVEWGMMAYHLDAYIDKMENPLMNFNKRLTPFKIAITTNSKIPKLKNLNMKLVEKICQMLREDGIEVLDSESLTTCPTKLCSVYDSLGIPWALVLNDETYTTGIADLRWRDTRIKEHVNLAYIGKKLKRFINAS